MSFLHRLLGADGVSQAAVETSKALRVTGRPMVIGARGAYSLSVTSGVMAAGLAANAEIFQFRWTSATLVALLRSVRIEAGNAGTAFAAGVATFGMRQARTWTVDGTGGTAITVATNDQKKKTAFATTAAPSGTGIRVASTAALGAGTKTLDGNDFAGLTCGVLATAGHTILTPGTYLWERNTSDEWPIYYAQNEGFVVRATVPITGTWTFNLDMEWNEIDPALIDGF